ncbi:PIN domain-containing protein, partial [Poseidonibacter sp.]
MDFEKYYVLDTNILLEDAKNIFTLADDAKNLIILPETILDEIDS